MDTCQDKGNIMENFHQDHQKGKIKGRRSGKDRRFADDNILIGTDRRSGIDRRKGKDGEKIMEDDSIFTCSWDEYEDWIKEQIKGDFSWKLRPIDSRENRKAVAESILTSIMHNNGTFLETGDMFIEKLIEGK